jgi:hypothetical protein
MQNEHPSIERQKLSPPKIAAYAGFAAGAILLVCMLTLLLFSDPFLNRFIKPRITDAFAKVYPGYSIRIAGMNYRVLKNCIGFDSVVVDAVDRTFSCNMDSFSVSGIGWMHLLWGGKLAPKDFAKAELNAKDITLNFPLSLYELHCGLLHASVPDSEIALDALQLHPPCNDEEFFAASKFRKTRFHLVIPRVRILGIAGLELLQGRKYHTRSVQIRDMFLDVLLNKDKPVTEDSLAPLMPNQILSSIKETLQVDRLNIVNGRLKYGERFGVGANPALITFDSIQALAEGIANHGRPGAAAVIHAQCNFMKAGTMNVFMSIPLASQELSYQYSGSMSTMDLSALNAFLETAEQTRIKKGVLQEATFKINVISGQAGGNVRAIYRDLTLVFINKQTRSEKGILNRIPALIVSTLKLRGTNVPDKSGSMKIGTVKHARQRDEHFLEFTWFALRSGVGNVVGF